MIPTKNSPKGFSSNLSLMLQRKKTIRRIRRAKQRRLKPKKMLPQKAALVNPRMLHPRKRPRMPTCHNERNSRGGCGENKL